MIAERSSTADITAVATAVTETRTTGKISSVAPATTAAAATTSEDISAAADVGFGTTAGT
jgi:hypothetical protein